MTSKLKFEDDYVVGRNWFIQTERVRDEGTWYFLQGLSPSEDRVLNDAGLQTHVCGRGGKAKVKAAAQVLADLLAERETR